MKTIKKTILALMLLLGVSSFAEATKPTIHVINDYTIILTLDKLASDIKFKLIDEFGRVLYEEDVTAGMLTFQRKLNLKSLVDGNYRLEIEDELKNITLSIKMEENKLFHNEITNIKFFKPVVYKKGSKVYLNKFSLVEEPIRVIIYNSYSDIVLDETITGKVEPGRIYTFKNSGDYTIAIKSNEKTYEHDVSIE